MATIVSQQNVAEKYGTYTTSTCNNVQHILLLHYHTSNAMHVCERESTVTLMEIQIKLGDTVWVCVGVTEF